MKGTVNVQGKTHPATRPFPKADHAVPANIPRPVDKKILAVRHQFMQWHVVASLSVRSAYTVTGIHAACGEIVPFPATIDIAAGSLAHNICTNCLQADHPGNIYD